MYWKKEKRSCGEIILATGQYWDTIQLGDGFIRVVKSKSKVYPKGY